MIFTQPIFNEAAAGALTHSNGQIGNIVNTTKLLFNQCALLDILDTLNYSNLLWF